MTNKDTVYIALFTALTAALGLFPALMIPSLNVPITAQSMGSMLAGVFIGSKRALLSIFLFEILAAIGLPILASGRGGIGIFAGLGGGFILAWPFSAGLIGYLYERLKPRTIIQEFTIITLGGIFLVYTIGILWLTFIMKINFIQGVVSALIFLPGDIVKVILTVTIVKIIRRTYPIPLSD